MVRNICPSAARLDSSKIAQLSKVTSASLPLVSHYNLTQLDDVGSASVPDGLPTLLHLL